VDPVIDHIQFTVEDPEGITYEIVCTRPPAVCGTPHPE